MRRHSFFSTFGISVGLHTIIFFLASLLITNTHSELSTPIEITLLELSQQPQQTHKIDTPKPQKKPTTIPSSAPVLQNTGSQRTAAKPHKRRPTATAKLATQVISPLNQPTVLKIRNQRKNPTPPKLPEALAMPQTHDNKNIQFLESNTQNQIRPHQRKSIQTPYPHVEYSFTAPPQYPHLARQQGWEGTVLLEVEVLPIGSVGEISIMRSSGYYILDQAATQAVQQWKFVIRKTTGPHATATVEIPVTFNLRNIQNKKHG